MIIKNLSILVQSWYKLTCIIHFPLIYSLIVLNALKLLIYHPLLSLLSSIIKRYQETTRSYIKDNLGIAIRANSMVVAILFMQEHPHSKWTHRLYANRFTHDRSRSTKMNICNCACHKDALKSSIRVKLST